MSTFDVDFTLQDGDFDFETETATASMDADLENENEDEIENEEAEIKKEEPPREEPKKRQRGRSKKETASTTASADVDLSIKPEPEPQRVAEPDSSSDEETLVSFVSMISEANGWEADELRPFIDAALQDPEVQKGVTHPVVKLFNSLAEGIARNYQESAFANEEVKQYNEYVRRGGSPERWFEERYNKRARADFSFEDKLSGEALLEKKKEIVFRYLTQEKGLKPNKAEKYINVATYEDDGSFEEDYEEAKNFILENEKKISERLLEEQREQERRDYEYRVQQIERAKSIIRNKSEIAGFTVPEVDRERLIKYMFEPDVDGQTQYWKDINSSEDEQIKLAYFMMKKLSRQSVERMLQSKVTKEFKLNLSKTAIKPKTSTTNIKQDPRTDVFNW